MFGRTASVARASSSRILATSGRRIQYSSSVGSQSIVVASAEASRSVVLGGAAVGATAAAWYATAEACGDRNAIKTEDVGCQFSGKVIVITGAAGDFGRTGIEMFRREGAHVVLLDGASEEAAETTLQLGPGLETFAVGCDMTDHVQVEVAVASIEKKFGRITHLWNNAGFQGNPKPSMDDPREDFKKVQSQKVEESVVGTFRALQSVATSMKKTGGGIIVNTASVVGLHGNPAMPAYVASKSAVLGLTKSAARDLAPFNIRVNAVSPGNTSFSMGEVSDEFAKTGESEEVIKAVLSLMSEHSSAQTGTSLAVRNDLTMH